MDNDLGVLRFTLGDGESVNGVCVKVSTLSNDLKSKILLSQSENQASKIINRSILKWLNKKKLIKAKRLSPFFSPEEVGGFFESVKKVMTPATNRRKVREIGVDVNALIENNSFS